jgi:hypothetical protein
VPPGKRQFLQSSECGVMAGDREAAAHEPLGNAQRRARPCAALQRITEYAADG